MTVIGLRMAPGGAAVKESSRPICVGCGTQFPVGGNEAGCPICSDVRLAPAPGGSGWVTGRELAGSHEPRIELLEPGLLGIGIEPTFAQGQRALLADGVLWDCIPLLTAEIEQAVRTFCGLRAIAVSHPHAYGAMIDWAERFDVPVLIHEDDRSFVPEPSPRIEFWRGDRYRLSETVELLRLGGHFPGASVCLWGSRAAGRGVLFGS